MGKPKRAEKPQDKVLNYYASPTLVRFHASPAKVRAIMGPIGSGKSVGCCMELYSLACNQQPDSQGIRRTRMLIVRNTLPELKSTTIKTWTSWFPPGDPAEGRFGRMTGTSPLTHYVLVKLPDGTTVDMEVIFLALDQPDDVKKLMSLECSAVWFNEARYIAKENLDAAMGRIGRYPSVKDGAPCTRKAIIMDTNPPDDQHWFYKLFEEEKPDGFEVFYQPSGLAPDAENLENLDQPPNFAELGMRPDGSIDELENLRQRRQYGRRYYTDQLAGKDQETINVYIHGEYGFVRDGYPVFAAVWNSKIHITDGPVRLTPHSTLVVGIDCSGRHPAACLLQRNGRGSWKIPWELGITDDAGMGSKAYARLLAEELRLLTGPDFDRIEYWGDPAGDHADTNEETFIEVLRGVGIRCRPAETNRIDPRIEVVEFYLSQLLDGQPLLQVSPACKYLIRGFQGGYQYRKVSTSGVSRPDDKKPIKNIYSNFQDALQYALQGIGGLREIRGLKKNRSAPIQINTGWAC